MQQQPTVPRITPGLLVVAGLDSSGGAGLAADIETASAHGLRATLAVTAITVQEGGGLRHAWPLKLEQVQGQVESGLRAARAVKVGMTASAAATDWLAGRLKLWDGPVVVDPVLATSGGAGLLPASARPALDALLEAATLITPNWPEARELGGAGPDTDPGELARLLSRRYGTSVLVKGGHGEGSEARDVLVQNNRSLMFRRPRLMLEARGTGCRLATAIACGLARGLDLPTAVEAAGDWLHQHLARHSGNGDEPVD